MTEIRKELNTHSSAIRFARCLSSKYTQQGEPQKREKGYAWQTAIELQAVDGLKPFEYLIETARKHIEGDITLDEVQQLIKRYHDSKDIRTEKDNETEEADKVYANITKLLNERSVAFTVSRTDRHTSD